MKIFFEDGRLKDTVLDIDVIDYIIDAKDGYSICNFFLNDIVRKNFSCTVYTNFLPALDNRYAWNPELKAPEVYIRNKNYDFVRIDTLTERELREGHNIMKMYMANEFGNLG